MIGDTYSLAEIGGADLARPYPDRGLIASSPYHNAILRFEPKVNGILSRLHGFAVSTHGFIAVLSADHEGLRILVNLEQFAVYIPWSEATISAERGMPATVVRLTTAAMPSLALVFDLDDVAADELFRDVVPPLPSRDPPRELAWSLAQWWIVLIFLLAFGGTALTLWLLRSAA